MKIALLQMNPVVGDLAGNFKKIEQAHIKAASEGADLLITSELALLGYPPRDLLLRESFINDVAKRVSDLARLTSSSPAILLGSAEINESQRGKGLFNSALLLKEGKLDSSFRKCLLPTYDVFDEERYFESFSVNEGESGVFEFKGFKFGVTICEDIWTEEDLVLRERYGKNPLDSIRSQNIDCLLNLSASPYSMGKFKKRTQIFEKATSELNAPGIFTNQVGGNDDLVFDGRSLVFSEKSKLLAVGNHFQEDLLFVELSKSESGTKIKLSDDSRSFDKNKVPEDQRLMFLHDALVMGVRDYLFKTGFKKAVIGLSGGIDSALVAVLAVRALGAENVLGVTMPSPYSSKGSVSDSFDLGKNLGIEVRKISISKLMDGFDSSLRPLFDEFSENTSGSDLTKENIQARIRGNLLMAISNKTGAMVLSTGNKSELSVGYCTLYGDMSGGLAVISDLPKTLVYKLSKFINKDAEVIPGNIITKAPSAELRPDQKDTDSLPEYDILDGILDLMVAQHKSDEQIVAAGFEAGVVSKVSRLVKTAEYKRKQLPHGLKVTDRAFGTGWRMPIATQVTE